MDGFLFIILCYIEFHFGFVGSVSTMEGCNTTSCIERHELTGVKECKMDIYGEKVPTKMRGDQCPIISNSCTTGHKLQGCTVDSILVNDWHYGQNWAYTVLSRVKTMAGLYLRTLLTEDLEKYRMSPDMLAMLDQFRRDFSLSPISVEDYRGMVTAEDQMISEQIRIQNNGKRRRDG